MVRTERWLRLGGLCGREGLGLVALDVDLHMRCDLTEQANGHMELTDGLERLFELDTTPLDLVTLRFQRLGDVGGGDGAEELSTTVLSVEATCSASAFSLAALRMADCFICSMTFLLAAVASMANFLGSR